MTGRQRRLIVLAVLAIAVVSMPIFSQGLMTPQEIAFLQAYPEDGSAESQYILGISYERGLGVPWDQTESVRWYRLAADQGHAGAQVSLGVRYGTGDGVPKDDAEVVRWFRLAADQGDADAQHALGIMYSDGLGGLQQDSAKAHRLYQLAAEQGHFRAMILLGDQYWMGEGVPQDLVQAHMWLSLAEFHESNQSVETPAALAPEMSVSQAVALMMTPAQIAEAQRFAREWVAAHPREP